jgi:Tfp pilus assembly protein FimT
MTDQTMITKNEKGSRGFTFFEVMLVLLLSVGTALIALPSLSRTQQIYKLSGAANAVRTQLSHARIQAISRNIDHRIRVVDSTSYVLERRSGGSWSVIQTYTMAAGFTVGASGTAEFHPRGTANSTATFTVTNKDLEIRQVAVAASGYINAL